MTSTARLLRVGFGALVVLLVLIAGARLAVGQYVATSVDRTIERSVQARDANAGMLQALTDAETALRGYQLTGEASFLQPYRLGLARYPVERAAIEQTATGSLRALIGTEIAQAQAWLAFVAPLAEPAGGVVGRLVSNAVIVQGSELFDRIRVANAQVGAELDAQRSAALHRFRVLSAISDGLTAALSILAAAGALVLGLRTSRLFLVPLEKIRNTLVRLSNGERAARAAVTGPPEVRQVIRALNAMADEGDRLRSSEASRAEVQRRAHELGARVRSSLDTDAILDEVVTGVGEALDADCVYVRVAYRGVAGTVDRLWCGQGPVLYTLEEIRAATNDEPWPAGTVVATGPAAAGQWGDAVPTADQVAGEVLAATAASSCLATPFLVDGESSGLLVLIRGGQPRAWPTDERGLVETVAADTGRALHLAAVYGHQRELAERFRDLDRQKTDFISTVSHELRTPLTSILGYLEIMLSGDQGELNDSQQRSLKVVERNAERLRELVGDLLTLSRIGSGSLEMATQRIQVAGLVGAVGAILSPVADAAGLTFECVAADDLTVVGDPRQLERVLLNVVGNAIKFTPSGGTVRVSARSANVPPHSADGQIVIEVADTGIGIPPADQPRLFQPFQRASNAVASAIQGTGLGLAIARSIVERHGGHVALESTVGEGATLTVVLPRAADESAAEIEGSVGSAQQVDPTDAAIKAAKARALARAAATGG